VVRVAHAAGFDHEVGVAAQAGGDQRMVHAAHGEQRVDRQAIFRKVAVGQDKNHLACAHRVDRARGQRLDRGLQRGRSRVVLQVERDRGKRRVVQVQQLVEGFLRQQRRVDLDPVRVRRGFLEQVALGAERSVERHHDRLADRVDRRVGHLGELLAQVVEWRTHFLREHGHRRVVAHRADRLAAVLGEHANDLVALLEADVVELLVGQQARRVHHRQVGVLVERQFKLDRVGLQPLAVGLRVLQFVVDVFGHQQAPGLEVGGDHLAGLDTALALDVGGVDLPHADFGRDGEDAVLGQHPARGPQAVAVERADGVAAVGQHHAGGAVPRLHVHRVVFVEGTDVSVHRFDVLPSRRDHQAQRAEQARAAHHQAFDHVVEAHRVGAVGADDGTDVVQVRDQRGGELLLACAAPVAVALHRVDLAVVRQIAERLRQAPLRPGVGREALVEHDEAGGEARVVQIRVEHREVLRHHQPFVTDHAARQRRQVEHRVGRFQRLFGQAAGDVELALEVVLGDAGRGVDEHLFDMRQGGQRRFAADGRIGRHMAEAGDRQALRFELGFQRRARMRLRRRLARQEQQAGGIQPAQREAGLGRHRAQEGIRLLEQQAAAVA